MNESLHEVISDFLNSCHRTNHHDVEENIEYFLNENNHLTLNEEYVKSIFYELEE